LEQTTLTAQKAELRAKLKQIRAAIPAEIRADQSQTIQQKLTNLDEIQAAQSIFLFISYGNEIYTHDLLKYFLKQGKTLAVPKILPEKTMIAVQFSQWEDLIPGELGILTPSGNTPYSGDFDVVITPGLGFTQQGHRIGYGRGYYDNWFASHNARNKIAIAFEAQLVDELPTDETDVPVDIVVTEERVIRIR
jgi:5-formyltetrahydrofolate cyclo-ligase